MKIFKAIIHLLSSALIFIYIISCSKNDVNPQDTSKNPTDTTANSDTTVITFDSLKGPTGLKITEGYYSLTLTWDSVTNKILKGYKIYRDTIENPTKLYAANNLNTAHFKDSLVALDTKYYYQVSAVDINNNVTAL